MEVLVLRLCSFRVWYSDYVIIYLSCSISALGVHGLWPLKSIYHVIRSDPGHSKHIPPPPLTLPRVASCARTPLLRLMSSPMFNPILPESCLVEYLVSHVWLRTFSAMFNLVLSRPCPTQHFPSLFNPVLSQILHKCSSFPQNVLGHI